MIADPSKIPFERLRPFIRDSPNELPKFKELSETVDNKCTPHPPRVPASGAQPVDGDKKENLDKHEAEKQKTREFRMLSVNCFCSTPLY